MYFIGPKPDREKHVRSSSLERAGSHVSYGQIETDVFYPAAIPDREIKTVMARSLTPPECLLSLFILFT
jgi:hypothetical protein